MMSLPKCAVMCRNVEELSLFYEAAKQQFAHLMFWDSEVIIGLWNVYGEQTGFTLFVDEAESASMSYCYEEWFRGNGYEIVEFSDIACVVEIEESEAPIESLFGLN